MRFLIIKYLTTAAIVVLVSEVAKRSDKVGALIASLPLVTLLVLFWLYVEKEPDSKIANHAYYTFGMSSPHCLCFWCFLRFFSGLVFGLP